MAVRVPLPPQVHRALARPVFANAASMFGTTVITSGLGFAYWFAAARLYHIDRVGIASAAISVMMLLATFGMIGMDTLIIAELAEDEFPAGLASAAAGFAFIVSSLLAVGYVLLQSVFSTRLGELAHGYVGPAIFVAGVGLTSLTMVLDFATIGINRGDLQLWRNSLFSASKLVLLVAASVIPTQSEAVVIYAAWLAGNVISLVGFWTRARGTGITPVIRPAIRRLAATRGAALAHHWLNIAAQAPRMATPVLVATVLSPTANAAYYVASLIVGFVGVIPVQLATALFALPRGQIETLAVELRAALRVSFGVGAASAVVFAVIAYPVLYLFGSGYTSAFGAMAVLGCTTVPYTVKLLYAAVERVRGHLTRSALISTIGAVLELGLAYVGAKLVGLVGVSAGLLAGATIEAVVLWPVIAHAAGTSARGVPSWLWHREAGVRAGEDRSVQNREPMPSRPPTGPVPTLALTGAVPSLALTGAVPLLTLTGRVTVAADLDLLGPEPPGPRPGDPPFERYWAYRTAMSAGWPGRRLLGAARLALLAMRQSPMLRTVRTVDVSLSGSADGAAFEQMLTFRAGPWSAPRVLLSAVDLGAPGPGDEELGDGRGAGANRLRPAEIDSAGDRVWAFARLDGVSPSLLRAHDRMAYAVLTAPTSVVLAVSDDDQEIVGIGVVAVDGVEAYLARVLAAGNGHADSTVARSVHDAIMTALRGRGIRRLWADGPLTTGLPVQQLQRDLGYECRRPRLTEAGE